MWYYFTILRVSHVYLLYVKILDIDRVAQLYTLLLSYSKTLVHSFLKSSCKPTKTEKETQKYYNTSSDPWSQMNSSNMMTKPICPINACFRTIISTPDSGTSRRTRRGRSKATAAEMLPNNKDPLQLIGQQCPDSGAVPKSHPFFVCPAAAPKKASAKPFKTKSGIQKDAQFPGLLSKIDEIEQKTYQLNQQVSKKIDDMAYNWDDFDSDFEFKQVRIVERKRNSINCQNLSENSYFNVLRLIN